MKNKNLKIIISMLIFIILCNNTVYASEYFIHGTVLEITEDETDEINMIRTQTVNVRIDEDGYSNQIIPIKNLANIATIYHIIVKANDRVIIRVNGDDLLLENCRIYSYGRDQYLLYLVGIFVLLILLISGKKGISSIISLALTLGLIFIVFFPLILNGVNPILAAVLVCIISTCITHMTIGKLNGKTYSAIIGTFGGILVAIVLTYIFGSLIHIQGTQSDSVELLSYSSKNCRFNFRDLLYAGIIIGTLGAIMDVCMSIASAMDEICEANPRLTNSNLFFSGMRIGKDVMGTMVNTLILAYVGSSINIILVCYIYGLTFVQFINSDQIASEILRAFAGSIGLVLSIPITSLCYLFFRKITR